MYVEQYSFKYFYTLLYHIHGITAVQFYCDNTTLRDICEELNGF